MLYRDIYEGWQADPEGFWLRAAQAIDWVVPPTRALNDSHAPLYEWFSEARVNTCWNAVDRHVEAGRGAALAIIHDSPVKGCSSGSATATCRRGWRGWPGRCGRGGWKKATG